MNGAALGEQYMSLLLPRDFCKAKIAGEFKVFSQTSAK
jgi:hypothetical protein